MKRILILLSVVFVCGCGYGQNKNDTTKVIMLVCDTSIKVHGNSYGLFPNPVGWQFGYEVTVTQAVSYDMMPRQYETTHISWLDENKKPLSKSIIVWQSKQKP